MSANEKEDKLSVLDSIDVGLFIIKEVEKMMPTKKNKLIKGSVKRIMNGIPPKK